MAGGQQSNFGQGNPGKNRLIQLRSRKGASGSAAHALSGIAIVVAQATMTVANNPPVWSLPATLDATFGVPVDYDLVALGYVRDPEGAALTIGGSLPSGWSVSNAGLVSYNGLGTEGNSTVVQFSAHDGTDTSFGITTVRTLAAGAQTDNSIRMKVSETQSNFYTPSVNLGIQWLASNPSAGPQWKDRNGVAQGSAQYGNTVSFPPGTQNTLFQILGIEALVQKWVDNPEENYGAMLRQMNPSATARINGVTMQLVVNGISYSPSVSTWVDGSTVTPQARGTNHWTPCLMRWDQLPPGIVVNSASFSFTLTASFDSTSTLGLFELDPPVAIDNLPLAYPGLVETGISAGVANDEDLRNHASVAFYGEFTSFPQMVTDGWEFFGADISQRVADPSFLNDPDTGTGHLQYKILAQLNHTAANIHRLLTALASIQNECYARWRMYIGPDVGDVDGIRMPGLDAAESGGVGGGFSFRTRHGATCPVNTQHLNHSTYAYIYGNNPGEFIVGSDGSGENFFSGRDKGFLLKKGRYYDIEQRVKRNTYTGGEGNPDGNYELWIDGVKVYSRTGIIIDNPARTIWRWWFNQFAFGFTPHEATYRLGNLVIASEYIGPTKLVAANVATLTSAIATQPTAGHTEPPQYASVHPMPDERILLFGENGIHVHEQTTAAHIFSPDTEAFTTEVPWEQWTDSTATVTKDPPIPQPQPGFGYNKNCVSHDNHPAWYWPQTNHAIWAGHGVIDLTTKQFVRGNRPPMTQTWDTYATGFGIFGNMYNPAQAFCSALNEMAFYNRGAGGEGPLNQLVIWRATGPGGAPVATLYDMSGTGLKGGFNTRNGAACRGTKMYIGGGTGGLTLSISNSTITSATPHGYQDGFQFSFYSDLSQAGMPSGINYGQVYYVRDATPTTFRLALTPGGAPITIGDRASQSWEVPYFGLWTIDLTTRAVEQVSTEFAMGQLTGHPQMVYDPNRDRFLVISRGLTAFDPVSKTWSAITVNGGAWPAGGWHWPNGAFVPSKNRLYFRGFSYPSQTTLLPINGWDNNQNAFQWHRLQF